METLHPQGDGGLTAHSLCTVTSTRVDSMKRKEKSSITVEKPEKYHLSQVIKVHIDNVKPY